MGGKHCEKKWLQEQYLDLLRSGPEIAAQVGRTKATVYMQLRKHGIEIRGPGKAQHLARKNEISIRSYLMSLLEGEVLADGSIAIHPSKMSAYYRHGSKYRDYLLWLSDEFNEHGLLQSGRIRKRTMKRFSKPGFYEAWHYTSLAYPELVEVRKRFYPDGKKIVPEDIVLNPVSARQAYIGDGSLSCRKGNHQPHIDLYTCGFDRMSIEILMNQLSGHGIRVSYEKSHNSIRISTYSTEDFLSWIAPCPPEIEHIYGYKWCTSRTGTVAEWQEQYKQQHNTSLEEADRCAFATI